MDYHFYVYILTNKTKSVLYVGFTNDLKNRLIEHYSNRGNTKTFAGRYYCYYLLHFEEYRYVNDAIAREKEIKGWSRSKKDILIASENPKWEFINNDIMDWPPEEQFPNRF